MRSSLLLLVALLAPTTTLASADPLEPLLAFIAEHARVDLRGLPAHVSTSDVEPSPGVPGPSEPHCIVVGRGLGFAAVGPPPGVALRPHRTCDPERHAGGFDDIDLQVIGEAGFAFADAFDGIGRAYLIKACEAAPPGGTSTCATYTTADPRTFVEWEGQLVNQARSGPLVTQAATASAVWR